MAGQDFKPQERPEERTRREEGGEGRRRQMYEPRRSDDNWKPVEDRERPMGFVYNRDYGNTPERLRDGEGYDYMPESPYMRGGRGRGRHADGTFAMMHDEFGDGYLGDDMFDHLMGYANSRRLRREYGKKDGTVHRVSFEKFQHLLLMIQRLMLALESACESEDCGRELDELKYFMKTLSSRYE